MVKLSRVLGLTVAFLVVAVAANCVFAAEGDAPKKKGFDPAEFWARIVKTAGAAEGAKSLTTEEFIKGFPSRGGATDRAKAIADKIAVDGKVTQEAFEKYMKDNPMRKRGKKGGDEKKPDEKKPDEKKAE